MTNTENNIYSFAFMCKNENCKNSECAGVDYVKDFGIKDVIRCDLLGHKVVGFTSLKDCEYFFEHVVRGADRTFKFFDGQAEVCIECMQKNR